MRTSLLIGMAVASMAFVSSGGVAQAQAAPPSAAVKSAQDSPAMTSRHTMDGRVTKVNAKKGWVDVKTEAGSMKLHFPPAALESVKAGDSVTVELAMARGGSATDTTSSGMKRSDTRSETKTK